MLLWTLYAPPTFSSWRSDWLTRVLGQLSRLRLDLNRVEPARLRHGHTGARRSPIRIVTCRQECKEAREVYSGTGLTGHGVVSHFNGLARSLPSALARDCEKVLARRVWTPVSSCWNSALPWFAGILSAGLSISSSWLGSGSGSRCWRSFWGSRTRSGTRRRWPATRSASPCVRIWDTMWPRCRTWLETCCSPTPSSNWPHLHR